MTILLNSFFSSIIKTKNNNQNSHLPETPFRDPEIVVIGFFDEQENKRTFV